LDEKGELKPGVPGPYGRTSWPDQFGDIEFFLGKAREEFGQDKPVFLMGHSMGGGLVLGFCTRPHASPSPSSVSQFSAVIATSPLIILASPAPKLKRAIGGLAANLLPNVPVPAETKADDLSHEPAINKAYENDPQIKGPGTLRGVGDMLNGGEQLLSTNYKNWPKNLPLLICHGSEDKVTSHKASEEFIGKIDAQDKTFTLYPGGYHELQNEPDGVKEKLVAQVIAFIEGHLQGPAKL
jgi:acylglycerol lipase